MQHNQKMTPELLEQVQTMRDEGLSYDKISRQIGMHRETVRKWIEGMHGQGRVREFDHILPQVKEDARRLHKLVPKDTRSLTGRIFGDPLPGRSALDRRARA